MQLVQGLKSDHVVVRSLQVFKVVFSHTVNLSAKTGTKLKTPKKLTEKLQNYLY